VSRAFAGLLIFCIFCRPALLFAQDGKLQRIREDVKGGDSTKSSDNSKGSGKNSDDDDCDSILGQLFAGLLAFLFDDDVHESCSVDGYFPSYPYAKGQPGYMWLRRTISEGEEPPPQPDFSRARGWSGRVAIEESNDFDGMNRLSLRLLLETGSGLGVQTNWSHVHENLSCGCTDNLGLGDLNVTYLFIQEEQLQVRAGLGARMLFDHYTTDFGFNFTCGADVYPCKPLVFSTTIDAGTLGSAGVFRVQGSIGFLHKRWEIYTGYDYLRIGSTALQGPILGLRLWF
jgi:hypothetical protein